MFKDIQEACCLGGELMDWFWRIEFQNEQKASLQPFFWPAGPFLVQGMIFLNTEGLFLGKHTDPAIGMTL